MELVKHRQEGGALGRLVAAELAGTPAHEREQRDRVARRESTQALAGIVGNRGNDELEAAIAKGRGGVERGRRSPSSTESRVSPSHGFQSRSSTVTKPRLSSWSATTQ